MPATAIWAQAVAEKAAKIFKKKLFTRGRENKTPLAEVSATISPAQTEDSGDKTSQEPIKAKPLV